MLWQAVQRVQREVSLWIHPDASLLYEWIWLKLQWEPAWETDKLGWVLIDDTWKRREVGEENLKERILEINSTQTTCP